MANTRFYQFLYSKVPMLSMIDGQVLFGASGAVTTTTGAGISAVTKLGTGIYSIQMLDNYYQFLGAQFTKIQPVTGSAITAGSFVTGALYQIVTVGSTNYAAVGLKSGFTAAAGMTFVATGVGSGTGTVKAMSYVKSDLIEVAGDPQTMVASSVANQGALIIINTYEASVAAFTGDTSSNTTISTLSSFAGLEVGQMISGAGIPLGTTITTVGASTLTISAAATATAATVPMTAGPAKILTHPVSGSVIRFQLYFKNSSVSY